MHDNALKFCKNCLLAAGASFVVNVVPNNRVISTSRNWASNGEDEPRVERSFQQLTDFVAFVVIWQVCTSTSTAVFLTWIGMRLLQQSRNNTLVRWNNSSDGILFLTSNIGLQWNTKLLHSVIQTVTEEAIFQVPECTRGALGVQLHWCKL